MDYEKIIDFDNAVKLDNRIKIENINDKSKTYFEKEQLKRNIKEIHNKSFFETLFSKRVYIIEGINDELFLKKLLFVNSRQYDDYSIFCCYGKAHMIPFVNIFSKLGIEVRVMYDSDELKHPHDDNNKEINTWLDNNSITYRFVDNLENELKFNNKYGTPEFIELLDNISFDKYEDYIQ